MGRDAGEGCPRRPLPAAQHLVCHPLLRALVSLLGGVSGGCQAGVALSRVLWLQYRVGQLYTISKHSHQESEKGEGVEVVKNEPHEDPIHGHGQFTEKRVHLSR